MGLDPEDMYGVRTLEVLPGEGERVHGEGPHRDLRCKSTRQPPKEHIPCIEIFLKLVTNELRELSLPKYTGIKNRMKGKMEALIFLESNEKITIKPSDSNSRC